MTGTVACGDFCGGDELQFTVVDENRIKPQIADENVFFVRREYALVDMSTLLAQL